MPWENKRIDFVVPLLTAVIMILGLIALYSTTSDYGMSYVKKQVIWDIVGLMVLFLTVLIRERDIRRFIWPLYGSVLVLLVAVLIFGTISGGARRWFSLGIGYFQPSELAKVALILLSAYLLLARSKAKLFILAAAVGLFAVLVAVEPDLGTAVLLVSIWFTMLIFSKHSVRSVFVVILIIVAIAIFVYFFGLKTYQRERILSFLNPQGHKQSAAYNVLQSIHVIGSGGILGRGYLKAPGTRWKYVPKNHTDFVFSAIGEQFGFVGASLCIILYMLMSLRILHIIRLSKDEFWALVGVGVLFNFVIHVFINIGMTMGLVPVTGIPLPFISYGGSSTLSFCIQLGLVMKSYAVGKSGVEMEVKKCQQRRKENY